MCKQKINLFRNVQTRIYRLMLIKPNLLVVGGLIEIGRLEVLLSITFLLKMCKQKFEMCIHVQTLQSFDALDEQTMKMSYRKLFFSNVEG